VRIGLKMLLKPEPIPAVKRPTSGLLDLPALKYDREQLCRRELSCSAAYSAMRRVWTELLLRVNSIRPAFGVEFGLSSPQADEGGASDPHRQPSRLTGKSGKAKSLRTTCRD
jgi:hypothetical protein